MRKLGFYLSVLLPLISFISQAQTGPHGVGLSTENPYWYNASDLSLSNGASVSSWSNSGTNPDAASQGTSSRRPIYYSSGANTLNGQPVVVYDGVDDFHQIPDDNQINTGNPYFERTVTMVVKTGSDVNTRQSIFEEGGASRGFNIYVSNGNIYASGWNIPSDGAGAPWSWTSANTSITANTAAVVSYVYRGSNSSTNGTMDFYVNGELKGTATGLGQIYSHAGDNALGAVKNDSYFDNGNYGGDGVYFAGSIAEFILYHDQLNDAEVIIQHNSLAARYGISFTVDNYLHDSPSNGNYDFEVLGLGQANDGTKQEDSKGRSILGIRWPLDLGNNEYFFVGHDNASISSWQTTEVPDANFYRKLNREWRVSEIGIITGTKFRADINDLPTIPSGYQLALFVDDDGDFSSGMKAYQMTPYIGSVYETKTMDVTNGQYLAIGVVNPGFSFLNTNMGGDESIDAKIELQLNFIPKSAVYNHDVNYSTTNSAATSGVDYTGTGSGTVNVSFSSNTGKGNFTIAVTDDATAETNEDFQVNLLAGTGYSVSGSNTGTYTIFDNDNTLKLYFATASSSGNESVTSGNIPVHLSAASPFDVSVNYQITGGGATNGVDYVLNSGTLTITGGLGLTSGNIPFTVTNDNLAEINETFTVGLSFPNGASLDNPSSPVGTGILSHTYTIVNDDFPEINFSSATSNINEDNGGLTLTVNIDQTYNNPVSVNYSVTSGSATTTDYNLPPGTLTINPGLTSGTINVGILNDCSVESTENFTISLASPNNGTLGSTSTHTITINDDDGNGPAQIGCGLSMWYKADAGITTNGTAITGIEDQTSNNNDGTQNNVTQQPQLVTNSSDFNYHDKIAFDGGSDYLPLLKTYQGSGIDQVYCMVVFKTDYSGSNYNSNWAFIDFDRSEHYNCYIQGNGTLGFSYNSGGIKDHSGTTQANNNIPHIAGFIYNNGLVNETTLKLDGQVQLDTDVVGTGSKVGTSTLRYGFIGEGSEADSFNGSRNTVFYDGDIAEIIVFENQQINPEELNRIESYLAIKYGITLNGTDHPGTPHDERDYRLSDGTVAWDYSANNTYNTNIAGLGRHDGTGVNQTISKSTGLNSILEVSKSGSFTNNNVIIWGNNGGDLTSLDDTPSNISLRTHKTWKVQEIGETGNLTLKVDLTGMTDMPSSASDFALLIDNDNDFSNATSVDAASLVGNIVTFNNVNLSNGQTFSIGCWKSIIWDGSNYSNGSGSAGAPNMSDVGRKLYIQGAGGVLSSNALVKEVDVEGSATFTIQSGNHLQTPGKVINDGTIIVENNASLIQTHSGADNNSGAGNYTVKRTGGTNTLTYDAWGSPVANQDILGTDGVFDGVNPCDIYTYMGATQEWRYDYVSGFSTTCSGNNVTFGNQHVFSGSDGVIDLARGYFVPGDAVPTREFNGQVNNGDISIAVSVGPNPGAGWAGDNWNLVANPYPSGLDAAAFVTANSSTITGSLYFWDQNISNSQSESDYVVWNAAGTVNQNAGSAATYGHIGASQGFFVEAASNGNVNFTNSMRSTTNNTFFKYDPNAFDRIRLTAVNPLGRTVQQLIAFHEDATDQRDNLYDARYLEGDGAHHFYSILDEEHMIIQTYNKVEVRETKVIPLGLKTSMGGKFSILLDQVDNFDGEIMLFDSLEMNVYDLRITTPQVLIDTAGTFDDRFYLMVTQLPADTSGQGGGNPTSVNDILEDQKPVVQTLTSELRVKSFKEIEYINVYDLLGKLKHRTNGGKVISIPFGEASSFVILEIRYRDGSTSQLKQFIPSK